MFVKKLKNVRLFNRTLKLLVLSFCFTFCTSVYASSSNAMPAIITYLLSSSSPPPETSSSLLIKTGQKVCFDYDTNETEVCNEDYRGQDGYYKKGIDPNFTRDDMTDIVTDNNTNLQWQDDINVTQYVDWSEINATCASLTLGGYTDWRVPNIDELETIVDYGRYKGDEDGLIGAINEVFENIANGPTYGLFSSYWSSTGNLDDANSAWAVNFHIGTISCYNKLSDYSVRCVRDK